ncbi:hypothetical protein HUJ04_011598 [Dendroctonus ponderosae]|nr:hypothetical protein HUJ04_011598 [Dendroctonus ponderosae]
MSTVVGVKLCGGPIISIVVVHLIGLDGKLGTREATNSKFGELSENSSKGRAVMNPNEGDVDDMTEQGADMLSLILGNSMSGEGDVAHAIQTGWLIKLELDRHAIICPDACLYLPQNIQVKEARYQVTKKHLEANVAEEAAAFVCEELRSAVALHNSTEFSVVLSSVQLSTSGIYRCEVSGEAPYFETVADQPHMLVVVPPESDPVITGGQPRYHIGDTVNVTCSIRSSKPAVNLTWLINERKADPKLVHGPFKQYVGREGLESSSIVLQFVVRQKHFVRGNMKLKCAASIATIYVRVNEKSFGGERPQKGLVLESRGTAQAPNGSRADRVHTSGAKKRKATTTTKPGHLGSSYETSKRTGITIGDAFHGYT